ncbi:hypothetical protein GW17_00018554 [Ensete ventricosum]|nr:hypothetical protein GW17_00018554 [Ensete ventricosum]
MEIKLCCGCTNSHRVGNGFFPLVETALLRGRFGYGWGPPWHLVGRCRFPGCDRSVHFAWRVSTCTVSCRAIPFWGDCVSCSVVLYSPKQRGHSSLPRRSYISVFQIRMENMKEVKRPPL